jgi:hypothetical protein
VITFFAFLTPQLTYFKPITTTATIYPKYSPVHFPYLQTMATKPTSITLSSSNSQLHKPKPATLLQSTAKPTSISSPTQIQSTNSPITSMVSFSQSHPTIIICFISHLRCVCTPPSQILTVAKLIPCSTSITSNLSQTRAQFN